MTSKIVRYEIRPGAGEARERLDKCLAAHLPELSRSRLKALILDGRLTADGVALTDPAHRVRPGVLLTLEVPPAVAAEPRAQAIALDVVYEDADLIVIDKPVGLVVHPAAGNPDRTLVNALLAHCGGSLSGIGGVRRPGIVHRLDKDTSGLMVAAKTDAAHHALAEQFAARVIVRGYRAVVWGLPSPLRGEIAGAIGRNPRNRKKMAVVTKGGKPALTRYRVERALAQGAAALLRCRLGTGRTHQIRVHLAHIGHPLIGDSLYGSGRGRPRALAEPAQAVIRSFGRQALHAWLLGFTHPSTGVKIQFESDLPHDIKMLVDSLAQS